jgi:hypothetical protein
MGAAFVTKVSQMCSTNLADFPAIGKFPYTDFNPQDPSPSQLPAVGAYFAQNQRGDGALESAIRDLGEPATGANSWNKVGAIAFEFLNNAQAQATDAEASNTTAFVSAVRRNQAISNELMTAAKQAGLPLSGACAQLFWSNQGRSRTGTQNIVVEGLPSRPNDG